MVWTLIVVLVLLWLFGWLGEIGGSLVHLLLVLALIALIYNLIAGRRSAD